jgi:S1-C subfamily serine protease
MKRAVCLLVAVLCASLASADEATRKIQQDLSVTIHAGSSQGSGVIVLRKIKVYGKDQNVSFVLTAAHVVSGLREVIDVIVDGSPRKLVTFKAPTIVAEFQEGGRKVGQTELDTKVLRYSDPDQGHDIAVLMVYKRDLLATGAEFYLGDKMLEVGTPLIHVGSLLGQMGSNSMTTGIVSQTGRIYQDKTYDQTTVTAFPGSSGGGVWYVKDGKPLWVAMLTRGSGETFNLVVPIRRVMEWAKVVKIEWLFDPSKPAPTMEELEKGQAETVIGIPTRSDAKPADAPKPTKVEILPMIESGSRGLFLRTY